MNFGLKSKLTLLITTSLALVAMTNEASAQGPLIKKLRSFNKGRPLLPFMPESKPEEPTEKQPTLAKKPTPAKAGSVGSSGSRTPTPAKQPTPARNPSIVQRPNPANAQSGSRASTLRPTTSQATAAKGFGMKLQQSGERFFISQVDARGNAAAAGLQRGDLIVNVGGAPVKVIEEYAAIAEAMKGGDRVEFEVSRRGSKPQKIDVQFGTAPPIEQPAETESNVSTTVATPTSQEPIRYQPKRYEPTVGSGLQSVYEGKQTPSSVFNPTPAPRTGSNRIQSLEQLDFPALELGR